MEVNFIDQEENEEVPEIPKEVIETKETEETPEPVEEVKGESPPEEVEIKDEKICHESKTIEPELEVKVESPVAVETVEAMETVTKEPLKTEETEKPTDMKLKGKEAPGKEISMKGKVVEKTEEENDSEEYKSSDSSSNTDSRSNLVDELEEEPDKVENLKEMDLKDVLKINSMSIDFGELFPGQILEETVIILNNLTSTKVPFKIKINCLSKEFDDLDEYVYSMRRPTTQDVFNYNDTFLILLAQKAISYYKLAIKVPNIMEEKEIMGNIEISCNESKNGLITIPIKSTIGKKTLLIILHWRINKL